MTWGGSLLPWTGEWALTGPRECVFLPERPEPTGGRDKHCHRPLSPTIFTAPFLLKCDRTSGCSSTHVVRANGWKTPVILVCVPHSPSSAEVRWTVRAGSWGLSCVRKNRMHLAHWTHQCWLQPLRAPLPSHP